jgi:hypothetical protein
MEKNMEDNKEDGLLATWRTQYKKYVNCFRALVNYDYQQHAEFNNMDYQEIVNVINIVDHYLKFMAFASHKHKFWMSKITTVKWTWKICSASMDWSLNLKP